MLAETLGINCSKRCELLIAYTCIREPENIVRIAYRLGNDGDLSAVQLARRLQDLPPDVAQGMSVRTLVEAGLAKLTEFLPRGKK